MGHLAVGRVSRFADVDAVTIDGYGTLLELDDPIGHLDRELRTRGVELPLDELERGFRAEVAYYTAHNQGAGDGESLARLYVGCAAAFLDALGLGLDPADFARAYPYAFRTLPGAAETVEALAARGLALAVVTNWDHGVHEQLRRHGLEEHFRTVVVSAEIGARKPDVRPFGVALDRLGVAPERAVHVGDDASDERGAAVAGLAFRPAPLATAFEGWA
jgi:HAD superfamily hydrolase (TIGR01509 family)